MSKDPRIKGVVFRDNASPESFSPDLPFDSDSYAWNPAGNGDLLGQYEIPILSLTFVHTKEAHVLPLLGGHNHARQFRSPVYWAQLDTHMKARRDSEQCLRRGRCRPMGGQSVWGHVSPWNPPASDAPLFRPVLNRTSPWVLLASPLDSRAYFYGSAYGAGSEVSGAVALVLAVDLVHRVLRADPALAARLRRHLVYALLTGEQWDAIGTRRLLHDVAHFECNRPGDSQHSRGGLYPDPYCAEPFLASTAFQSLDFARVEAMIGLGDLSPSQAFHGSPDLAGPGDCLYFHTPRTAPSSVPRNARAAAGVSLLKGDAAVPACEVPAGTPGLPPHPVRSLRTLLARDVPSVVIGSHSAQFHNPFRHSRFDRTASLPLVMSAAATAARTALLEMGVPAEALVRANATVNATLAAQLVHCLTVSMDCTLVQGLTGKRFPSYPASHDSGVYQGDKYVALTADFLRRLLAVVTPLSEQGTCTKAHDCLTDCERRRPLPPAETQCLRGRCVRSTVYLHRSYSPAAAPRDDTGTAWSLSTNASLVRAAPVWTESEWGTLNLVCYIDAEWGHQALVLVLGALLTAASVALFCLVDKRCFRP